MSPFFISVFPGKKDKKVGIFTNLRRRKKTKWVWLRKNLLHFHKNGEGMNFCLPEILWIAFVFQEEPMQGKVEICGVNTARLNVLSQADMDVLLRKARQGDEQARQKLIEGNLRLVLSVIQRFEKRGESPDDLFQVG